MDNEQKQIPKELKRKKLDAATLASSKFRDALESCEKLSKFDCFVDYDYGDYYVYDYYDEQSGTQDYKNLEYYDEQSETEDYENLEYYDEQSETQDYEHLQY